LSRSVDAWLGLEGREREGGCKRLKIEENLDEGEDQ